MSCSRKIFISTSIYLVYSLFFGLIVSDAYLAIGSGRNEISTLVLALLSGPSLGLGRGHGAELWIFASVFCLPLLWIFLVVKARLLKAVCAFFFLIVWFAFGWFLAN